jgi:hypothetical protein
MKHLLEEIRYGPLSVAADPVPIVFSVQAFSPKRSGSFDLSKRELCLREAFC